MRLRFALLLIIPFLLNCPKKYKPDIESIEVLYLSSLHDDIYRDKPILAGIKRLPGFKVGHLKTNPAFLGVIMGRLGFYELLNNTGIEFVVTDSLTFWTDNINYFLIPKSMGYAIKNHEGIRFAILRKDKDILTMDDEIKISLVKQRSDILWIIENKLIDITPVKINFFIKDRGLTDTTMTALNVEPDSLLLTELKGFKGMLEQILNKKTFLEDKTLQEYILSTTAQSEGVEVILYPQNLFINDIKKDSVSLREILNNVVSEMKFTKTTMDKKQIQSLNIDGKYKIWGKVKNNNSVLLPDNFGMYLFDMFYKM
ncbi:MAG: hypothetical protein WBB37_05465 [bacterium]